ncbi:MAG: hypothetical protein KY445_15475 [Armatimonadetes bacterium]|nr:hypothetical protein [Armatimonadota bacterium]
MAFLGSILRARRGDFNLFLIAALVALLVVPGASQAALPPQSCEAVLFWLQSETASVPAPVSRSSSLLSISHQKTETAPQILAETQFSAATFHCGQWSALPAHSVKTEAQIAPATLTLERHVAARLSGVRTNRRLI